MDEASDRVDADHIAAADARVELERLLADGRFHVTDRNRAFLRYIAEESLAGRSKGVKAYSVAIDVFGRPCNFDPNIDPIVRIEAARLRASLDQYYDAYGGARQVRIHLPRGNYITEFSRISGEEQPAGEQAADDPPEPETVSADIFPLMAARTPKSLWPMFSGIAFSIVVGAGLVFATQQLTGLGSPSLSETTEKPLVILRMAVRNPLDRMRAEGLMDGLMIGLSRFGTLRMASDWPLGLLRSDTTEGIVQDRLTASAEYQILLKYSVAASIPSVMWTIVDARSGETLASGEERPGGTDQNQQQVDTELIATLATRFGPSSGILNNLELRRPYAMDAQGNICVLRAEHAINLRDSVGLAQARSCLEATIISDVRNDDAQAALSRILVLEDEANGTAIHTARALELSNQATTIAPVSDRSLAARMTAQYANGQRDAAFETGRAAMAVNPLNADIAAALALRLYISGNGAEALAIAGGIAALSNVRSRDTDLVLALDAYMQGREMAALRRLDSIVYDDSLSSVVRIAALVRAGKPAEAAAAFDATRKTYPRFPFLVMKIMKAMHFTPALQARLGQDLAIVAKDWSAQSGHAKWANYDR